MKVIIVVGARPNFMKAAPLISAIREYNTNVSKCSCATESLPADEIRYILVHTGQHYDEAMSGSFFVDLHLPTPDVHLGVGSGSHAAQTGEIMKRFEEVLLQEQPDAVVVVGDVNSTLACTLVASKISLGESGERPLIAHVEAGLRSFDRTMPEEINRIITDHLSDLLFVTEESGIRNLEREGISLRRIHFVGNTMIDSLIASQHAADKSQVLNEIGIRRHSSAYEDGDVGHYAVLTLHRASNVDRRETFLNILEGLGELAASCPIFFPAHPRTRKRIAELGLEDFFKQRGTERCSRDVCTANGIKVLRPLGYYDFLCLMKHAQLVITDSGGIQEETTCLGIPCVTVRDNTERPVTVTCGTNVIAGTTKDSIRNAIRSKLTGRAASSIPDKWDGKAGERIVETIALEFQRRNSVRHSSASPHLGVSHLGTTNAFEDHNFGLVDTVNLRGNDLGDADKSAVVGLELPSDNSRLD
jgi:UDP-N-acetylglucosamine 2-epimerase (non-hydrolysing)